VIPTANAWHRRIGNGWNFWIVGAFCQPIRNIRSGFMRTFLGMILGALLTVAGAYLYDSMQTSSVATGPSAGAHRTMVNWDVVSQNWQSLKLRTQAEWNKLSSG
jgi:hypothetical protein